MNLGTNIAAYATICKHLDLPFIFPGGPDAYTDDISVQVSDADLIAQHIIWEATTDAAKNQVSKHVDHYRHLTSFKISNVDLSICNVALVGWFSK